MMRHPWLNLVTPIVLALGLLFVSWSPLAALAIPNQPADPAAPAAAPGAGPALAVTPTLDLSSPLELEPDGSTPAVQPGAQPRPGYQLFLPRIVQETGAGHASTVGRGPMALFSAAPLIGSAPLTVSFTHSLTQAATFVWDFGDGAASTLPNPTHVYTQAGVYTVRLTTSNDKGEPQILTQTNYLTVLPPSPASSSLFFIENEGQFDPQAQFVVRGAEGSLFLAEDALWLSLLEKPDETALRPPQRAIDPATGAPPDSTQPPARKGVNLKLSFPGANPRPRIEPFNRLETKVSYFIGSDPGQWRPDVPLWGGVRYIDLYPGVDLEVTGENGRLAQRLVVRDPAGQAGGGEVRLRVEGAETVSLAGDRLSLKTAIGDLTWPLLQRVAADGAPLAPPVQPIQANEREIIAPFAPTVSSDISILSGEGTFDLRYSTFLGGSSIEYSYSLAVDDDGNAYVTGYTYSSNFPVTAGAFDTTLGGSIDAFVTKVNPTGTDLSYSTFLGGSSDDYAYGLAVDGDGNAYVTGGTSSSNFPVTAGAFDTTFGGGDVFVTKLNASGTGLSYSTFLGSGGGLSLAVDDDGNAYVTGSTSSSSFPVTAGAFDTTLSGYFDAFVTRLNASGSGLGYSTFLGGSSNEQGLDIAVDGDGNAYVTGGTDSSDFPVTAGAFATSYGGGVGDAFVTKLNASGTDLSYSTFLGGSDYEDGYCSIAVDDDGQAYVTGYTYSSDFPVTAGAFATTFGGIVDTFVTRLNANGTGLSYSTFLGGGYEYGSAIALDDDGNAYVTGATLTSSFPTTPGAFDTTFGGSYTDAFVTKLNASGTNLSYSTFLDGSTYASGSGIAVDGDGDAYVTGNTGSSDFPTTPGAFDTTLNSDIDSFVTKLALGSSTTLAIAKTAPASAVAGSPITYTLTVTNTSPFTATSLLITDTLPGGAYYVSGGTQVGNVVSWTIPSLAGGAATSVTFVVTATTTLTNSDYAVVADGGLSATGQVSVTTQVYPPVVAAFSAFPLTGAAPLLVQFFNNSTGADTYLWRFGDGITATLPSPTHTYTTAGVYTVSLTTGGPGGSDTLTRTNYITVTGPTPASLVWWNDDFFYRRPLTLTASSTITYDNLITKVVRLTFDMTTLVTAGKMRPDGQDLRVVYQDETGWTELARNVQDSGTATTTVLFPLRATITGTSTAYWLYYGNAVPDAPPLLMEEYAQAGAPYWLNETGEIYVDFQAEPVIGLAPLAVTLTNLTFPAADQYEWDFGDGAGSTTTLTETVHIYQTPGVYTVSLTAITGTTSVTIVQPGLIWAPGLDVSGQVSVNPGSFDETPVVSTTISASLSDTQVLTSAEGIFSVSFPPGAVSQEVIVTHSPYRAVVKQGSGSVTRFALTAQTPGGQPVTQFSQPLTLTLDLAWLDLTDELAETAIFLTWDEAQQQWTPITTTIDLALHRVYGQVNHFSDFMAFLSGRPGGPPPAGAALAATTADAASGASTFAVPIALPPGTAGMQPAVSLGYNSLQAQQEMNQLGGETPGLSGIGTFLNLSYIGRSNQETDREVDELDSDQFFLVLDGRRLDLIKEAGVNRYHTEDETFWRIERDSAECSNGAQADCAAWLVTTKDGTIYTFGQTADSIQRALAAGLEAGGGGAQYQVYVYPGRYYLNRVEDVNGNYMTFEYGEKLSYAYTLYRFGFTIGTSTYDQAVYLTDIRYTGNDGESLPLQRSIQFEYESRAEGEVTDFVGPYPGGLSQGFYYDRRLAVIEARVEPYSSSPVRRYTFDYGYLTKTGLLGLYPTYYLTLRGVSLAGDDASNFDLVTRFDYYDEPPAFLGLSNEFGLLRRVNTLRSGETATHSSVEYSYEAQSNRLIASLFKTSAGWLVSQRSQSAAGAEPLTLTYTYDEVTRGQKQGPVVDFSTGPASNYGEVTYDYWRVAVHDALSGRTTIQAFFTQDERQANPLAGRLAWTETFTDPNGVCTETDYRIANALCPLDSYLTGQYLTYQQNTTYSSEGGDKQATFVAPAGVDQASGPLVSGVPFDRLQTGYGYDAAGNVIQVQELGDPDDELGGRVTNIVYTPTPAEQAAHVLNRPKSLSIYPTADDPSQPLRCMSFVYVPDSERPAAVDRIVQRSYRLTSPGNCTKLDLVSTLIFDDFGNLVTSQGAAGEYQVAYDPLYFTFPMTMTYPVEVGVGGGFSLTTGATYNPAFGLVSQAVAMNGAVTTYSYDPFGRLESVTTPASGASTSYTYAYDATGLTLTVSQADGLDGLTGIRRYNGLGQLDWEQRDGETGSIRVEYEYDRRRLDRVSVPYAGATPSLWTTYRYDDLDRPTAIIHPDGSTLQTEYTGWSRRWVSDENQHVTLYEQDVLGWMTQVTEYTGTLGSEAIYATTTYTYNALGYLTEVQDQAGNLTQMEYDSVGRLLELDDPDQGLWQYFYADDGPLTSQRSALGIDLAFEYDNQNRLTSIYQPEGEGGGGETFVIFSYDTGSNGQGQRASMTDPSGYTTYDYDPAGRLVTETREIDGLVYQTGFSYDPLDRVETVTYPDGEVISYTYNAQGLLETLATPLDGGLNLVDRLDYNVLDQPTDLWLGDGGLVRGQFGYYDQTTATPNLALRSLSVTAGSTTHLALAYEYDNAGHLTGLAGAVGPVSLELGYSYDPLNRLVAVSDSAGGGLDLARSYSYNAIGNLVSKDGLSYDYSSGLAHAPNQVGDLDFSYDANGNRETQSGSGQVSYRYHELNRLTYVISDTASGESVTQAVYDGDGQRVKRLSPDGVTVTIGQHYEVFYPASPNQTISAPGVTCSYTFDRHSSPRLAVDGNGGRHLAYQTDQYLCYYHLAGSGQVTGTTSSWSGLSWADHYLFDLAADSGDTAYLLLQTEAANGDETLSLRAIANNTWLSSTTITTGTIEQTEGSLAVAGDGTAHVVWLENANLYYAQVAGGVVTAQQTLTNSWPSAPRVAVDAGGAAHVVWRQADGDERIYYMAVGGAPELVSDGSCQVGDAAAPALAVAATGRCMWPGGSRMGLRPTRANRSVTLRALRPAVGA
jgi:uncharacterized repeat protein (TIGR01451 family)